MNTAKVAEDVRHALATEQLLRLNSIADARRVSRIIKAVLDDEQKRQNEATPAPWQKPAGE